MNLLCGHGAWAYSLIGPLLCFTFLREHSTTLLFDNTHAVQLFDILIGKNKKNE